MNGPAGAISFEAGEVKGFGDDSLADKGAIAVNEDRNHFFAFGGVVPEALAGAGLALDDRVDRFEMARVGGERETDFFTGRSGDFVFVAKMIFDVAIAEDGFRDIVFVEFGKEFSTGFPECVHENVEATAMGHADDDLLHAGGGAGLDQSIENGDEGFAAFQRKSFLADVAGVEESFEGFGRNNLFEDAALLGGGERGLIAAPLHLVAKPAADGKVHDVHELDPDVFAVGLFEERDDFAQGAGAAAAEGAGIEDGIQVGLGETESGEGEIGVFLWGQAEGIEVGEGVSEGAVGEEEVVDAGLGKYVSEFRGGATVLGARGGASGRAELAPEFESLEESLPSGFDTGGVGFPSFVQLFEKSGVARMAEATESRRGGGGCAIRVEPIQRSEGGITS